MKHLIKLAISAVFLIPLPCFSLNTQYSVVPGTDLYSLGPDAEEISLSIERFKHNGKKYLNAVSDYHAVFDLPIEPLADIIADHDNGEKVFKRMVDTIDLNPEDPLNVPHRQKVHNSAKFLGIGQDYIYTTVVTVELSTGSQFAMHWRMIDCEEGNFEEYEGFWYLESLELQDGKPRTYVRCYAETLFNNPIPLQDTVMKMFTKPETEEVFESVYRAASAKP